MHVKTQLWVTNGKIIPSGTEELVGNGGGTQSQNNYKISQGRGRMWWSKKEVKSLLELFTIYLGIRVTLKEGYQVYPDLYNSSGK